MSCLAEESVRLSIRALGAIPHFRNKLINYALIINFASPWVDSRATPGELFFTTNKNHSKLPDKGHKIDNK